MNFSILTQRVASLGALLTIGGLMFSSASSGAEPVPAQTPLLSKAGGGVKPNIMLTLDDSGSMTWRHMPETVFAADSFSVNNSVGSYGVGWDTRDTYHGPTPSNAVNWRGSVPGNITSKNYVLKALRSSDTNTLFYNPEILYLPWANADGVSRLVEVTAPLGSPPSKAYLDPMVRTGAAGTYIDLTTKVAISPGAAGWCFAADANTGQASGSGCANVLSTVIKANAVVVGQYYIISKVLSTDFVAIGSLVNTVGQGFTATAVGSGTGEVISGGFLHDPGVYFRLQRTVAGVYKDLTVPTNYDAHTINAVAGTKFPRSPKRTDCATTDLVAGIATKCSLAEERQNFANWFSYYRTRNLMARGAMMEAFWTAGETFRLGWGRINKPSTSIDGVSTPVVEAGVRSLTTTGVGNTKSALYFWLQSMPASGGTPLPAALDRVGQYYSRTDSMGPYTDNPGQTGNVVADNKTCRRSYHILTTDGYWTSAPTSAGDSDSLAGVKIDGVGKTFTYTPTGPFKDGVKNTLADYAMKYWKTDIQPGMYNKVAPVGDDVSFWQNMTNFTVGLGVRGQLNPATDLPGLTSGAINWPVAGPTATTANVDDLWHAAINSRGQYFSAKDPGEVASAIKTALNLSSGGTGTTAGVATASTVLEDTNRKYVPTYTPGEWSGDIAGRPLDKDGQAKPAVWNAAKVWPVNPTAMHGAIAGVATDWNQRNIVTWDAGLATPQGVKLDKWSGLSNSSQVAMGSMAATYQDSFINFLRGDHSQEGVGKPFRSRTTGGVTPFVLGDFINSNPVFVQKSVSLDYGRLAVGGGTYEKFVTDKAKRVGVLFAGANDGMLHAFKDSKSTTDNTDGQEVFAYVPSAVYPNLSKLADKRYGGTTAGWEHQFFVDGWQRETDAYLKGNGTAAVSWRNYLMGSLGAGGKAIYALDVTDTVDASGNVKLNASTVRWEFSSTDDSDLGYVMSPIEVGVLPSGKWVALVSNGQGSSNGKAVLFVLDMETGAILQKLQLGSGGSNGLGGVGILKNSANEITRVYAGDLQGYMWRMDYESASTPFKVWESAGSTKAVFRATNASGTSGQPITQAPLIYKHSKGGALLVFGTGKLFEKADSSDLSRQAMYGVWDKDPDTVVRTMTRSNLESRAISKLTGTASGTFYSLDGVPVDWDVKRGWVVDLELAAGNDLPGLRVIYPPQYVSNEIALISTVAPAQTAVVCEDNAGQGIGFLVDVEQGANPKFNAFDTDGVGGVTSTDQRASGYATGADGIDSIVYSPAKTGSNSVADGSCAAGYYRVSIQNTTGQMMTCIKRAATPGLKDRVQRRIINPPIR